MEHGDQLLSAPRSPLPSSDGPPLIAPPQTYLSYGSTTTARPTQAFKIQAPADADRSDEVVVNEDLAHRLGLGVGWASRLGADSMGRYLMHEMQCEGIDCTRVVFDAAHEGMPDALLPISVIHGQAINCIISFSRDFTLHDAHHLVAG